MVFNYKDKNDMVASAFDGSSLCLYYWEPPETYSYKNFGDEISHLIVRAILKENGYERIEVVKPIKNRAKLLAVGSIIQKAAINDIIWGSGINGKIWPNNLSDNLCLDIRMVRGPLTKNALNKYGIQCPANFGDPGLLFADLYKKNINISKGLGCCSDVSEKIVYIPNLNDERFYDLSDIKQLTYVKYISPSLHPFDIAKIISESHLVISSSLHGLIIADSYNIPSIPMLSYFEPIYKYIDYYEGTGRSNICFANSISDALSRHPVPLLKIDLKKIKESFPLDRVSYV